MPFQASTKAACSLRGPLAEEEEPSQFVGRETELGCCQSISMPRKVRQVVGPSVLCGARGMPSR